MPVMMGMSLLAVDLAALMSLMGHLIYGVILGLVAATVSGDLRPWAPQQREADPLMAGPGSVFGEMMLVGQRMYDNYAEAIEDSSICQLSVDEVERFLLSDQRIAIRISRLLGEQVARLEERLTDLALRPLSAQVASTLLKLGDAAWPPRFGQARAIHLTHERLAGFLGASGEAPRKIMGELTARKAIRQGCGRMVIQDRDVLHKMARSTS